MSNQIDFSVLFKAPLASVLAIILGFGLAWLIIHYVYRKRLQTLKDQLDFAEEMDKRQHKELEKLRRDRT